ncbi:unnamed protein product [Bemisia tabaci]|uniref:RanBD1 domain-containing protein n=1 Tax=Bemisia tabaci TaxID=7038 RepID=A0A9P0F1N9_BEMTA|nr:unnamed protein product [Bemisia tabaci]
MVNFARKKLKLMQCLFYIFQSLVSDTLQSSQPNGADSPKHPISAPVFEQRAAVYRFCKVSKLWKQTGTGAIQILKDPKYRLLFRKDKVHKAALNIILNREMKLISMKCASAKMLFAPNLAPYHEQLAFKLEDERSMTQFTNFFNRCITEIDGRVLSLDDAIEIDPLYFPDSNKTEVPSGSEKQSKKRTFFEIFDQPKKGNKKMKKNEEGEESIESSKEKRKPKACVDTKRRPLKFQNAWMSNETTAAWLKKEKQKSPAGDDMASCKYCNCRMKAHFALIKRHGISEKHLHNAASYGKSPKLKRVMKKGWFRALVRRIELKLLAFLACEQLPLNLLDTLTPFLQNLLPDVPELQAVKLKRTKGTKMLKSCLASVFQEQLLKNLRGQGSFIALIFDETTDITADKQLSFVTIYVDKKTQEVKTRYLGSVQPSGGTAEHTVNAIKEFLASQKISLQNIAAMSADTCNVNFGVHGGVFALLKRDLPHLVTQKCSCHLIHLVAQHSTKEIPTQVEEMLRKIAAHFHRSSMRQEELQKIQEKMKSLLHKMLSPSDTRWLANEAAINRAIEQYEELRTYFKNFVATNKDHADGNFINSILSNECTLPYLEVMAYALSYLTNFNTLFQSTDCLLYKLKDEVHFLLKTFTSWFIQKRYLKKDMNYYTFDHTIPERFVKLDDLDHGIKGHDSFLQMKYLPNMRDKVESFSKTILSFYVKLVNEIKTKFSFVFTDPLYNFLKVVNPDQEVAAEIRSLSPIFSRFPYLKELVDYHKADVEWSTYLSCNFEKLKEMKDFSVAKYWKKVLQKKNYNGSLMFPNLKVVMYLLLILPFSNACVERIFSQVNLIKTALRNSMDNDTLDALLVVKYAVEAEFGNCINFEPCEDMISMKVSY